MDDNDIIATVLLVAPALLVVTALLVIALVHQIRTRR